MTGRDDADAVIEEQSGQNQRRYDSQSRREANQILGVDDLVRLDGLVQPGWNLPQLVELTDGGPAF